MIGDKVESDWSVVNKEVSLSLWKETLAPLVIE